MVLAEKYAVERRLHEMLESNGFACRSQIAEQHALADEVFLFEFMQPSEKFLTRRKGRDADGRPTDLVENPLNYVGQLNALGEVRLCCRFLQGLQFIEHPTPGHYSNVMPMALSSSMVASENSAPAFLTTLTAA